MVAATAHDLGAVVVAEMKAARQHLRKKASIFCWSKRSQMRCAAARSSHHEIQLSNASYSITSAIKSVQRQVITVFAHNRVNNHPVTDKAFRNDARRKRRGLYALFFTTAAGALLSLGYKHEVFGRFDVLETIIYRPSAAKRCGMYRVLFSCTLDELKGISIQKWDPELRIVGRTSLFKETDINKPIGCVQSRISRFVPSSH